MGYPSMLLFIQGVGKLLYEPFRVTAGDFNRAPNSTVVAVFLWTVLIGYFRNEVSTVGLEYINAGILMLTLLCIMWTEYLISSTRMDRLFDRKFIKDLMSAVMYISFPVVLMFYVWFPLYDRLPCLLKRFMKDATSVEEWRVTTWVMFACFLFLSAFYGVCRGLNKPNKYRRSVKYASPHGHTPVTRSMSRRLKYV